ELSELAQVTSRRLLRSAQHDRFPLNVLPSPLRGSLEMIFSGAEPFLSLSMRGALQGDTCTAKSPTEGSGSEAEGSQSHNSKAERAQDPVLLLHSKRL
ncbi:MAG: hypothetical protein KAJ55_15325, partial [Anaerolineales bacterium]|nr:hypothetical protein [Anaerolineales bacterium]